ncbi:hypothetical protein [Streptomyces sp. NPDC046887]|uniref:hypothetical protein n=1 Tax=Streptomyces sp. NPDC046887 TaxID=3155472 RepID=UPI0033D1774B
MSATNPPHGRERTAEAVGRARHEVRLPGFLVGGDADGAEGIGLGDAIKRATSTAGIRPCGGCLGRAAALNRWMRFSSTRPPRT